MSRPYTSPLRVHTAASGTRYHYFPQANGGEAYCEPRLCREHWREQHWQEGQTHGR